MATMRCAVWIGGRDFRVEERPLPEPGPGEVRVRVGACGVCLTEVHTVDGLIGQAKPPWLMGHEIGGVVEAIGPDVEGVEVGTAVACAGNRGFAEYVILPANRIFPVPGGAAVEEAALVEPLLCCVSAVNRAAIPMGAAVLVTGAGPMGLMTLQVARRRGAVQVIVSEPNPSRRELALRLGADLAVDPREGGLEQAVESLTHGRGVDVAFETAGVPAPLADCMRVAREDGTVVMVGVNPVAARLDLELYPFHRRNLTLTGSYGATGGIGFADAAKWLNQIELQPLISHRFALDAVAEAFDVARGGRGHKVLVLPQER